MLRCTTSPRVWLRGALLLAALTGASSGSQLAAQDGLPTPPLSPHATVSRTIGLTDVAVDYHAPCVRGREIFGAMVPFGVVWRTGANGNTKISFSADVLVEGQALAAGDYGLHTIPGEDSWEVIFNTVSDGWGSYNYNPEDDALRVMVKPMKGAHSESMVFRFDNVEAEQASLVLAWGDTVVPVTIAVDVVTAVLEQVRTAARENDERPGSNYWFEAGDYGRDHGLDNSEMMDWADRSIAMQKSFANLWLRSELLADVGKVEAAGEAREAALGLADMDSLQQLGYRYILREDMVNAEVVFGMVLSMEPTNWWPYAQMGKVKSSLGDDEGAAVAWRAALTMNPDDVTRADIQAKLAGVGES
ncbi:MAG: hypothetical protein ACI9EF_003965 [Pseudohongiellaceae bacterium]|jgi:hypothetical protein